MFSARNLWDMQRLYDEYKDAPKLRQLVAKMPWGQNLLIMARAKTPAKREYYLRATAEMAWTRNVLLTQMKASAHERHARARKQHNFEQALPDHLRATGRFSDDHNWPVLGVDGGDAFAMSD